MDDTKTLVEVERSHLAFDHTTLGEEVAASWGFPEATRASIRYHHASVSYEVSRSTSFDVWKWPT